MATNIWQGDATARKQIETYQVSTYHGSTSYILTFTDEAGGTVAVTQAADTDAPTTAAAMQAQLAAHESPVVRRVTATVSTDTITLTATTAGVPFNVAETTSGGSGAWTEVVTTTNRGPNDWNTVENWSRGALHATDDDVAIPAATSSSILYGLDQSSGNAMANFIVQPGYTGQIGGTDGGYLHIHNTAASCDMDLSGTGQTWLQWSGGTADNITLWVRNSYSPPTGQSGVYLKGFIKTINISKGDVSLEWDNVGDASSGVDDVNISYTTDPINDSLLRIGSDIKTDADSGFPNSLVMTGGKVITRVAFTTIVLYKNSTFEMLEGAPAVISNFGGTVIYKSTGTISTLNLSDAGKFLVEENIQSRTVSACNVNSNDGVEVKDPGGTVTWSAGLVHDNVGHDNNIYDFGTGKTLTPS
jgi:hypothetical protein